MSDQGSAVSRVVAIDELTDHTLSFLQSDPTSLKNCTLVSKQWDAHAARHLFASFTMCPNILMPISGSAGRLDEPDNLQPAYFALKQSESSRRRVVHNVRHITLLEMPCSGPGSELEFDDIRTMGHFSFELFKDVLATFPRLRSVDSQCRWNPIGLDGWSFQTAAPNTPLVLDEVSIMGEASQNSPVSTRDILSLFQEVRTVQFRYHNEFIPFRYTKNKLSAAHPPTTKVTSLVLHIYPNYKHETPAQICAMVTDSMDTSALTSLTLDEYSPDDCIDTINTFLRVHAYTIEKFTVTLARDLGFHPVPVFDDQLQFALGHCPRLRSVHIELWLNHWRPPHAQTDNSNFILQNRHIWQPMIRTLLGARAGSLKHIRIKLSFVRKREPLVHASTFHLPLHHLDYALLDRVVEQYPDLTKLEMQVAAPAFSKACEVMKGKLAGTAAGALVTFASVPQVRELRDTDWRHASMRYIR